MTFKKNGEMAGIVADVYTWAVVHKTRKDPETLKLIEWLKDKIDKTHEHRKAQRTAFAHKNKQKEEHGLPAHRSHHKG